MDFHIESIYLANFYTGRVFLQSLESFNKNKQSLKKQKIFLAFKLLLRFPVSRAHGSAILKIYHKLGRVGREERKKKSKNKRYVIIIFFVSLVIKKQNR